MFTLNVFQVLSRRGFLLISRIWVINSRHVIGPAYGGFCEQSVFILFST